MDIALNRKMITGGFALALLCLSLVGAVSYGSIQKSLENQQWLVHTHEVLDTLAQIREGLRNAEAGRRGYIISGDPLFLASYKQGIQKTEKALENLQRLSDKNPLTQQSIQALKKSVARKLENLRNSIKLLEQNPWDKEIQIRLTEQGRQIQAELQPKLIAMERAERALLLQRVTATENSLNYTIKSVGFGYGLGFTLLFIVYIFLNKEINYRQEIEESIREINKQLEKRIRHSNVELYDMVSCLRGEIIEGQRTQTALEESEAQLRLALEAANMGIWDWNIETSNIRWSSGHEQLFGLIPGTFDGSYETFEACVHPEDRESIIRAIADARERRQDYQHQYRVVWPDRSIHWIEAKGKFYYDAEGRALRTIGTVMEIDDLKRAEEELRQSEQLLRNILATIPVGVWIADARGNIVQGNPAGQEIWTGARYVGIEQFGEYKGWWADTGQPIEPSEWGVARAIAKGETSLNEAIEIQCFDGTRKIIINSAIPLRDAQNNIVGAVSVNQDITALKQLEADLRRSRDELDIRVRERTAELARINQELQHEIEERQQTEAAQRESEAKFRSLSESSPIGIFMMDDRGQCTYTNPRAGAICGYTLNEALGNGWLHFVHPEDRESVAGLWSKAFCQQQELSVDVRYLHDDQTVRFGRVRIAPIVSAESQLLGHVGTIEDITESRAIEQMKQEFISVVSHELRTPLASIRGSLGLLAAGVLKHKPETAQQMLEIASSETQRLVRLVNDILDLDRLASGRVILSPEWCDALTLIEQSVKSVQTLAESSEISLSVSVTSVPIWADSDRIVQTLVNLLSNAIKFSQPQSTVSLRVTAQTESVVFQVQDQGRGIPADKLETIFGRFQQVDASDSRQKGGTGLGLAICRSIVEQHGGQIWVESVLGDGSIFSFTLPTPVNE